MASSKTVFMNDFNNRKLQYGRPDWAAIATSGCRSLSQTFGNTFSELVLVKRKNMASVSV